MKVIKYEVRYDVYDVIDICSGIGLGTLDGMKSTRYYAIALIVAAAYIDKYYVIEVMKSTINNAYVLCVYICLYTLGVKE